MSRESHDGGGRRRGSRDRSRRPAWGREGIVAEVRALLARSKAECEELTSREKAASASTSTFNDGLGTLKTDLDAMLEVLNALTRANDGVMIRSTVGVMDALKTALREMKRVESEVDEGGRERDEVKRKISLMTLFALSKLATAAREEVLAENEGEDDVDGVLELMRVQCKAPDVPFTERMGYVVAYFAGLEQNHREKKVEMIDLSESQKTKQVIGGLARAFASQQDLLGTPEASDDETTSDDRKQSTSSLCASPSKIFYSPRILNGQGDEFEDSNDTPQGTVICRMCEQPIPSAEVELHNSMCTGMRSSSLGSSREMSPRVSASDSFVREESDQVTIDDFRVIKLISGGAYGRVFLAQKRSTGDMFAVKAMRKSDLRYKNMMEQVISERDALITAANPFTIKLYYSFTSARHVYLVTEYANGGDLYSLLSQIGRLSEHHARQYCSEIVLALEYIHSKGIIHRDLKPGNCLIASDGHIKLADFGLSRIDRDIEEDRSSGSATPSPYGSLGSASQLSPSKLSGSSTTIRIPAQDVLTTSSPIHRMTLAAATGRRGSPSDSPSRKLHRRSVSRHISGPKGTPDYLAPEVLLCEPCGEGVDWWALGVMTYEMIIGVPPFTASTPLAIFSNIVGRGLEWPKGDEDISDDAKSLIEGLLMDDVETRLGASRGADDVKSQSWFDDVKWEHVYDKSAASVFVPKPMNRGDTSYFVPTPSVSMVVSGVDTAHIRSRSGSRLSEDSLRDDVLPLSAVDLEQDTDEDGDEDEEDEDDLQEFTYKNLAELALRNMQVSETSDSAQRTSFSNGSPTGMPRRGSIGKDLKNL